MIAEEAMEALWADLATGRNLAARVEWLEELAGPDRESVGRELIRALDATASSRRKAAFFGLQHCWIPAARDPVIRLLADADPEVRRMAAVVLGRGEGRDGLARALARHVSDPDPAIAGPALETVESMYPDLERMRVALSRPALRIHLADSLPRYYAPVLSPACRTLLDDGDPSVARAALVGLIEQNDCSAGARARMLQLLHHPLAEARELSAGYLSRHGVEPDSRALEDRIGVEPDPHARAAMAAALDAIRRRRQAGVTGYRPPPAAAVAGGVSPLLGYREAAARFDSDRSQAGRQGAFERYCTAEAFEPCWYFQGQPPGAEFLEARRARFEAQQRLFAAVPHAFAGSVRDRTEAGRLDTGALVAPIRDYPGGAEAGFGEPTDRANRPFTKLVHVGDDVGWGRDGLTVVAIADGMVRETGWTESWGNFVVIEHALSADLPLDGAAIAGFAATIEEEIRLADGGLLACSLYAHLDPFLCVLPGERVRAGRKVGGIGRAYTWDNGGYPSHLHFAMHLGPYWQRLRPGAAIDLRYEGERYRGEVIAADASGTIARILVDGEAREVIRRGNWLCGYVARWLFQGGAHGWLDPRPLLAPVRR